MPHTLTRGPFPSSPPPSHQTVSHQAQCQQCFNTRAISLPGTWNWPTHDAGWALPPHTVPANTRHLEICARQSSCSSNLILSVRRVNSPSEPVLKPQATPSTPSQLLPAPALPFPASRAASPGRQCLAVGQFNERSRQLHSACHWQAQHTLRTHTLRAMNVAAISSGHGSS